MIALPHDPVFPPGPLIGLGVLAAAVLTLAGVVEHASRRALEAQPPVPERWFGFGLRVQWATLAVVGGWPWTTWQLARAGLRLAADPDSNRALLLVLGIVPACAFAAWAQWRANEGFRRLRDLPWSAFESFERAALPWIGLGACLTGLLLAPAMLTSAPLGLLAVLVVCVAVAALAARSARRFRLAPGSVTSGELRDRLFALAARAGVRLDQLYVVPMARLRLANAFAVQGRSVVLTDYLLEQLDRDEVDAVLAHELAHHRLGHPTRLGWALLGLVAVPVAALQFVLPAPLLPLVLVAGLLGFFAVSRRFEYAADAGAIAIGAKPSALVAGLETLGRVNQVPDRWSRGLELWLTHPSVERRRAAIERLAAATPAAAPAPVRVPVSERYTIPGTACPGAKVFSTEWKLRVRQRAGFALLGASVFVPALAFAVLRTYDTAPRLLAWPIATALAALACVLLARLLGRLPTGRMRRRLRERDGAAPRDAWLVGVAPGADSRIFEGFHVWDVGFLSIERGRLVYRGEETSFSITPDLLADVALVSGPPGWTPTGVVRLEWDDAAGRPQCLRVLPLEASGRGGQRARCRAIHDAIDLWRAGSGTTHDAGMPVRLPIAAEVTSVAPAEVARPGTLVGAAVLQALAAAAACALLALPFDPRAGSGLIEVWLAAVVAHAVLLIPMWRHREPARIRRRATPRRAAA